MPLKQYDFETGLKELARALSSYNRRTLVAIAGGSCSGKTFFSKKLHECLAKTGSSSSIIKLDDYFRDIDDPGLPLTDAGELLFDAPGSFHEQEFVADVSRLLGSRDIMAPRYIKPTMRRTEERKLILASQFILAEGLYAIRMLAGRFARLVKIYIDADESIRLERRVARDISLLGVARDDVEWIFQAKILPCHKEFNESQKKQADFVITNN
ncbi:hypothetical protein KJ885_05425 [Patescibacteria group bacterium]|nr:hypothetical protein [Patescibacteria group bacterium]